MQNFLSAIPAAATSNYAFVAYAICAVLFIFGGAKLRELRSILKQIAHVPKSERVELIRTVTGKILPKHITAEQWIRNNRNQGFFSVAAAVLVLASAVGTVAILTPTPKDIPPGPPPPVADAMKAAESFMKQMDAGEYAQAWNEFYAANKELMSADRWVSLSNTYRVPIGKVETRRDAGLTPSQIQLDRRLNGLLIGYYTKFANLEAPIQEQIGVASPGAPTPWRVVSYTVAVPPDSPLLKNANKATQQP
jgi:hypothetical protein